MWQATTSQRHCNSGRLECYALTDGGVPVSYANVIEAWKADGEFRTFFIELLKNSPLAAYRWETPAVTPANLRRPFEFVLLEDLALERAADESAFAEHFRARPKEREVVSFTNLRGDAVLVVPTPQGNGEAYAHLAVFMRGAPDSQVDALWQEVGNQMARRVVRRPIWLSTAGLGVAWLHVRLDDRPKYYGHTPYRVAP